MNGEEQPPSTPSMTAAEANPIMEDVSASSAVPSPSSSAPFLSNGSMSADPPPSRLSVPIAHAGIVQDGQPPSEYQRHNLSPTPSFPTSSEATPLSTSSLPASSTLNPSNPTFVTSETASSVAVHQPQSRDAEHHAMSRLTLASSILTGSASSSHPPPARLLRGAESPDLYVDSASRTALSREPLFGAVAESHSHHHLHYHHHHHNDRPKSINGDVMQQQHWIALINSVAASAHTAVSAVVSDLSASLLDCANSAQSNSPMDIDPGSASRNGVSESGDTFRTASGTVGVEDVVKLFAEQVFNAAKSAADTFLSSHRSCGPSQPVSLPKALPTESALNRVPSGGEANVNAQSALLRQENPVEWSSQTTSDRPASSAGTQGLWAEELPAASNPVLSNATSSPPAVSRPAALTITNRSAAEPSAGEPTSDELLSIAIPVQVEQTDEDYPYTGPLPAQNRADSLLAPPHSPFSAVSSSSVLLPTSNLAPATRTSSRGPSPDDFQSPGGSRSSIINVQNLVCPTCSKGFSRRYNLKTHMASHLDVRPHQCGSCGSSFARNHDLVRHRQIHDSEKVFVCENCDRGFLRKDALTRHQSQKKCGTTAH
ncbi:hypothetical protein DFJ73DRAFT_854394 [Zopfochytrium polystomum]|nr:hypothetical protein DFJ73DRAFT_854394 [Zopfochytrium polystomum]